MLTDLGIKKLMNKRGGGVSRFFASKIFCLTVRKSFVDKPFWVSLIWVSKNFMLKGVRHDFSSNSFCLAEPKNFAGEPFCAVFQKIPGSEIFKGQEEGVSISSVAVFLSHSAKKIRR